MAVVCAGGLTMLVLRRVRSGTAQPKVIQVAAASRDLAPGITLSAQDLTMIDWPADVALKGSFSNTDAILGRPLISSVGSKEPVVERDLGAAGSGYSLSARIPSGMRATAVRSNDIVGVAGFLFPGSHVDVLATYTEAGVQTQNTITQTVLQDVEVLTVGATVEPDPSGKPQSVNVVTLLLTPEDSQKLLLASTQGTVQFVLRSNVDQTKVDIGPTRSSDWTLSNEDRAAQAASRKSVSKPSIPLPKRATSQGIGIPGLSDVTNQLKELGKVTDVPKQVESFTTEVIQGTQRTTQKF